MSIEIQNSLNKLNSIVFDCDGVLLDSNKIKTEAFYKTALPFGEKAANSLVSFHVKNGGISRNKKLQYFIEKIVSDNSLDVDMDELLTVFGAVSYNGLLSCRISPFLYDLRKKTLDKKWFVVSGGSQVELHDIFKKRSMTSLFDGGIYGSPATKDEIFDELKKNGLLKLPSLYLGDSKYDYIAAKNAGLDFIFVSGWTEYKNWEKYCRLNGISYINSLQELIF